MSTKIYYGYRMKISKLNDFIDMARPQVFDLAEEIVRKLMSAVKKEVIQKKLDGGWFSETNIRFEKALELVHEISAQSERMSVLDIDFSFNIWIHDGMVYVIPIGEEHFKRKLVFPEWVEDYSYWDNTDPPNDIDDNEWMDRAEMWEKINCGSGKSDHNARRLNHSVIDMSQRYGDYSAMTELRRRIVIK